MNQLVVRTTARRILAVVTLIAGACEATAAPVLTLQPNGVADLANLAVGQSVSIDMVLSGLPQGQTLGYLAGTATFSSSFLGSASVPVPGTIVPDASGFLGVGAPGLADGSYDFLFANSSALLTQNGPFFTFSVAVQQAGTGIISTNQSSLAGRSLTGAIVDIGQGPPLTLTARASANTMPEPATWLTWLVIATAFLLFAGHRRRWPVHVASLC